MSLTHQYKIVLLRKSETILTRYLSQITGMTMDCEGSGYKNI